MTERRRNSARPTTGAPEGDVARTEDALRKPAPHEVYTTLLAHELRTPVTVVLTYLQLLERADPDGNPEVRQRYLSLARAKAADLARIVSELTAFTDLTNGHSPTIAALDRASRTTVGALIQDLTAGKRVRAEVTAEADAALVDTERLRVALEQVIDNALRFGKPDSEVLVSAVLENPGGVPRLVVRITNEGDAIPDAVRALIFEPFRQGEQNHRVRLHGGLGLGLTVARLAVEGAGGFLGLESGPFTTFRLDLPQRQDPVAQEARLLREQVALADAQAQRAVRDFRAAHHQALVLAERLDSAYLATITALARAVEIRDHRTGGHVERVRRAALEVAKTLGVEGDALRDLDFGALLHDVGKIGVPDAILSKEGPLTTEEHQVMRGHPEIGRRMLEGIPLLQSALDVVLYHHERWDGSGYPRGLAGATIPLAARIVAVVDVYDSMTSHRPYRAGLTPNVALVEIGRGRGTQFDPVVVDAFLSGVGASFAQQAP